MDDDIETSPPTSAECTAVRVTPLSETGEPDHRWGLTYRFAEPVTLVYIHRRRILPVGTPRTEGVGVLPALVAVTAPRDHPQRHDIAALAQGLWQARRRGAAVDAWAPTLDGAFAYSLLPHWQHLDRDHWNRPGDDDPLMRTYAAGCAYPCATAFRRAPYPPSPAGEGSIEAGTHVILSVVKDPPPPQGFPALSGATEGEARL